MGTRTSEYWESRPGRMDTMNAEFVYPSLSAWGIPQLEPTGFVPTSLAAWHVARQREYAAETGGAVHFFLDDYRFETVWSSPARSMARVQSVGVALTPDFSLWRDLPMAALVWQVYRARWCGAYWQQQGVTVIPTASWAREDSFAFCFDGLPAGGSVAVSAVGVRSSRRDRELFRAGIEQLVDRVQPSTLLVYGPLRFCDGLDLPRVVEYPTFWDRRRREVSESGR